MTVLALVRHGRTAWNLERRLQGRADNPLDEVGEEQARAAGALLAERPWSALLASPLLRARQTAAAIGTAVGLETVIDDSLIERDFGELDGTDVDAAYARYPERDFPGSEPVADVIARSAAALRRIGSREEPTIVVAHGTFLRIGLSELGGVEMPHLRNGDVYLLDTATGAAELLGA